MKLDKSINILHSVDSSHPTDTVLPASVVSCPLCFHSHQEGRLSGGAGSRITLGQLHPFKRGQPYPHQDLCRNTRTDVIIIEPTCLSLEQPEVFFLRRVISSVNKSHRDFCSLCTTIHNTRRHPCPCKKHFRAMSNSIPVRSERCGVV